MSSRTNSSLTDIVYQEHDTEPYSSSMYRTLENLVSLDGLSRTRDELLSQKDTLTDILGGVSKDLELHDLSAEEIEEYKSINKTVTEGREKLSTLLTDYNRCRDEICETQSKLDSVKQTIRIVERQLTELNRLHEDVGSITEPFVDSLLAKEQSILDSFETELGLLCIQKDKLEAMIKALSRTYGILKNSALTHTCPICITYEVDMYLEPCGHTICSHCNKSKYCHMCRTKIREAKSIYYS